MRETLTNAPANIPGELRQVPIAIRGMAVGVVLLGGAGGLAGLLIGLRVHAPTAWFAVLELGLPAGLVGGLLGLAAGGMVQWMGGVRPSPPPSDPVDDDFAGRPPGW